MADAKVQPEVLDPIVPDEERSKEEEEQGDGVASKDVATPASLKHSRPHTGRGLQQDWGTLKCHEKVYNVMFDPNSGTAAKIFTVVMSTIVVVSIVFFCMGTMPVYETPEKKPTFDFADFIFNIIFTVEFCLRVAVILPRGSCPQKELVDAFMVVDFLAILPAIIQWMSSPSEDPIIGIIFLVSHCGRIL
jgi:hypothetical protein